MTLRPIAPLLLALFAGAAQAHPGHGDTNFWTGLLHLLTGPDHLLATIAVGCWAVLREEGGGRALLMLPGLFVVAAGLGMGAGLAGAFDDRIETAVAASLLPLGLALLCGPRGSRLLAWCLVPICGVLHGGAHARELAGFVSSATIAGFMFGTAMLHMAGTAFALSLPATRRRMALAGAGTGIAAAGAWLLA